MKLKIKFFLLVIVFPFLTFGQTPVEPAGTGTQADPYQIATLDNLAWLSAYNTAWWSHKYSIQTADIDASATATWNNGEGFLPIGGSTPEFAGTYDGGGYTISNLYINRTSAEGTYQGMFKYLTGTVRNVNLVNVDITGYYYVAGISGYCAGIVENCSVTGNITATYSYAGGIIATLIGGTVSYCSSNVNVISADQYVGGLIGKASNDAQIYESYSKGNVTGKGQVGGLVGKCDLADIDNCYTSANVTTTQYSSAAAFAGGIFNTSSIDNCYATGTVTNGSNVTKGFIGYSSGTSYTTNNNFFDSETTGQSSGLGATAKTTSQMKTQSTFTGWDFTDTWAINADYNNGYPHLQSNVPPTNYTWTGLSTNWDDVNNWYGGAVPTASDYAIISKTGNSPVISSGVTADCNFLIINSGAALTVEPGGSLIPASGVTNNGTFNMELSMTDNHWHLVSSPVSGAKASVFTGDYLQYYDETLAIDNYIEIGDGNTNLDACKGYAASHWSKSLHTFIGTPHTGDQSIITTSQQANGWNLVGNPYPSSIDWDMLSASYGTIYTYVDNGSNNGWAAYNTGATTNGGVRYIPPMQGFFISTSGDGTFAVSNSHRTHENADGFVKSADDLQQYVKLIASTETQNDETFIQFGDEYKDGFDQLFDGWKMNSESSESLMLYSKSIDGNLSIDRRPETAHIQMGFKNPVNGITRISIKETSDLSNIELEDTKLNTFHDLTQGGAYTFNWQTTDSEERFVLHLKATGVDDIEENSINIYSFAGQVYVSMDESDEFEEILVYDLAGRLVYQNKLQNQNLQSINLSHLQGAYLIQLVSDLETRVEKVVLD